MGATMKDTEREIERTRRYLERLVRVSSSQSEHYPASSSLGGFTAGEAEMEFRVWNWFNARFPANEKRRDLDRLDADGDK